MALQLGYAVLMLFTCLCLTEAKRGYIMTAPSQFIPGRSEKVCIDMVDINLNVSIELSLYKTAHTVASQPISFSHTDMITRQNFVMGQAETTRCVTVVLPVSHRMTTSYLALSVRGEEVPFRQFGWSFYGQNIIRVLDRHTNTEVTLIQTDKLLYKPAQLVQIRVMRLDTRLRPLNQPIERVHIQTPSGVTIEQWLNVAVKSGLASLSFKLADDLERGNWSVILTNNGQQEAKIFTVEDYVLPSYEVTIRPPGYALLTSPTITAQICALYTYGQPVSGRLAGQICLKQPFVRADIQSGAFCQNIPRQPISGCKNITANRMAIGWDHRYNDWKNSTLVFQASVTEDSTGTKVKSQDVELKFASGPHVVKVEGSEAYKPGLPYHAKVIVTSPDGVPSLRRPVNVEVDQKSSGQSSNYNKMYTTDNNGCVFVTIPPFITQSLTVKVSLIGSSDPSTTVTINPKAWYSPSGSFLQILPSKDSKSLLCGGLTNYRVQYTTSTSTNVTVLYKVIGVSDIADTYDQIVSLAMLNKITNKDPQIHWDTTNDWNSTSMGLRNAAAVAAPVNPNKPEFDPVKSLRTATHKGSFTVKFRVSSKLSPQAYLVVYYVRADGEVVSDSTMLTVPECAENKVSIALSRAEVSPGDPIMLTVSARPGSVCGYGIVDKNAVSKPGQSYPTLESVVERLRSFLLPTTPLSTHLPVNFYCENLHGVQPEFQGFSSYWKLPTSYRQRDSHQGFAKSGLVVASNLNVKTAPCKRVYYRTHSPAATLIGQPIGPQMVPLSSGNSTSSLPLPTMTLVSTSPPAVPNRQGNTAAHTHSPAPRLSGEQHLLLQFVKDVSTYFPETMLFDIIETNLAGQALIPVKVPDTITQWTANAVCTSENHGLGVSSPVTLTTFHPFSVKVMLPSMTAIRGEVLPLEVTIANYLPTCIVVDLKLKASSSFDVLRDPLLGPLPPLCVCGGETVNRVYHVAVHEIGEDISVTISGTTVNQNFMCPFGSVMSNRVGFFDSQTLLLTVEPEGIRRDYTVGDYVCVDSNRPNATGFNKNYRLPRVRRSSRVRSSTLGVVTVVGDVMGTALSNIDNLINLPTSCGEQNVIRFLPNVFALKYMDATLRPVSAVKRKEILQKIRAGYQRQLTFAHPDGSYSAFGPNTNYDSPSDVGSIWLTAYVLKSLAQAQQFIYIDTALQQKSLDFIVKHQDAWGCFPEVGFVPHDLLKGAEDNFVLTAYVTVALLEAGLQNTQRELAGKSENVVEKALECIFLRSLRFVTIRDGYTMSQVAYAFALHNTTDPRAVRSFRFLERLRSRDRDRHFFWRAVSAPRINSARFWFNRPTLANVEATSYALLTTMLMANRAVVQETGLASIKWLSEDRNSKGGYGSTLETVVSVQAFTEFGTRFASRNVATNVTVSLTRTVNRTAVIGDRVASFSLTNQNAMNIQTGTLPTIRTINVQSSGVGCLQFQTHVTQYIQTPDQDGQPFHTNVTVKNSTLLAQACRRMPLLVCTSYMHGDESNMAVMEVKMQTGWAVEESLIKQLYKYQSLKIHRYEINEKNRALRLFFTSLSSARTCFFVYVNKIANVRNGQPAVVTTYDYYKTATTALEYD